MTATVLRALAESSVRATVLAALVGVTLTALRIRASELRHTAWTMVVCAMLALPLVPWLPIPSALAVPMPFVEGALDRVTKAQPELEAVPPSQEVLPFQTSELPDFQTSLRPDFLTSLLRDFPTSSPPYFLTSSLPDFRPLSLVYVFGVLVSVLYLVVGWRTAARLARRSRTLSSDEFACDEARMRPAIAIRESAALAAPVTVGIIAPTILLPIAWRAWSEETRRAVLAHEVAHVDRRDPLVLFVARVNRCLFWFHPLAWWLPRTLAAHAEHASDAVAVAAIGSAPRYANVLVDMAQIVRAHGGRLSWHGAGIGGNGALGTRIDRVLRGPADQPSRIRAAAAIACCIVAMVAAAACRPERTASRFQASAATEQRDRALRAALRSIQLQDYRDFRRANWESAAERIAALESAAAQDPDDLDALRDLLIGYWVLPSIEKRRAQILRLVERHPDDDLAGSVEARLFPRDVDASLPGDPIGYEQVKALWLAHANRPDASVAVLGNASYFFETSDRALAETLLLRAQARDPQGPWRARLGAFYARILSGIHAPGPTPNMLRVLVAGEPRSSSGILVRQKLGESTDEVLLTAAAWSLARSGGRPWVDFDPRFWAETCLKRALQIDPGAVLAHTELLRVRRVREYSGGEPLWSAPPALQYQTVSAVPEVERFGRLPQLARQSLTALDDIARWHDPNLQGRFDLARQHARQYAEDALALAPRYRSHPEYGTAIYTANMTLGALALRDGDTASAVRFLLAASAAPSSEELAYGDDVVSGMRWHLAADLLDRGERDAVLRFVTRMAETNLARRTELREAAEAIRRGETPRRILGGS